MMGGRALGAISVPQLIGAIGVIGGGVVLLTFSIGRQVIPGSRHPVSPWLLGIGILGGLLLVTALLFPWAHTSNFAVAGWRCSARGLMIALIAGALAYWSLRRGVILRADLLGASVGLLAGLAGVTVLQFNCPILEAAHIIVWHVGIAISSAIAGFLFGRVWISIGAGSGKR
jgi:hypothetical protein